MWQRSEYVGLNLNRINFNSRLNQVKAEEIKGMGRSVTYWPSLTSLIGFDSKYIKLVGHRSGSYIKEAAASHLNRNWTVYCTSGEFHMIPVICCLSNLCYLSLNWITLSDVLSSVKSSTGLNSQKWDWTGLDWKGRVGLLHLNLNQLESNEIESRRVELNWCGVVGV